MRKEVENFLMKFGVFKVGIADPEQGFKMAFEGCHPRDVMRNCNSVIVFALHVGLDYYTTLEYAYEAGLGVYGRQSLIITREYGPRVNFGVVLTNAYMKPDKPLKDFNPCKECNTCAKLRPVKAVNEKKTPPTGFNRKRCLNFIDKIRQKTERRIKLCGYCYNHCPAGEVKERTFNIGRWKTLIDLDEKEKGNLLKILKHQGIDQPGRRGLIKL